MVFGILGVLPVVESKEKNPCFIWQISKCGVVGSERGKLPATSRYKQRAEVIFPGLLVVWRAGKPFSSVILAENEKHPYTPEFAVTESKFLPRCQNPQFCGFAPRGKLVGECLPQTLLCALAGEKTENSFCYFPKSCPMGEVESFLPQTQKNFCYFPKSSAMKGVERFLRPK